MSRMVALVMAVLFLPACGADEPGSGPASSPAESGGTPPPSTGAPGSTGSTGSTGEVLASLTPAARRYVDAVAAGDLEALVAAFVANAVVVDVSREIRGRDAIRTWARNEVIGGRLTVLRNTPRAGGTTMLVRFQPGGTGGFQANYDFEIANELITRATLSYA